MSEPYWDPTGEYMQREEERDRQERSRWPRGSNFGLPLPTTPPAASTPDAEPLHDRMIRLGIIKPRKDL